MTDQMPGWLVALVLFVLIGTGASVVAMFVTFLVFMWETLKKRGDDSEDGGWGGSGGWTRPSGPTPGGGGGWEHDQFNRELDLIGKTIPTEEEDKEKVGAGY